MSHHNHSPFSWKELSQKLENNSPWLTVLDLQDMPSVSATSLVDVEKMLRSLKKSFHIREIKVSLLSLTKTSPLCQSLLLEYLQLGSSKLETLSLFGISTTQSQAQLKPILSSSCQHVCHFFFQEVLFPIHVFCSFLKSTSQNLKSLKFKACRLVVAEVDEDGREYNVNSVADIDDRQVLCTLLHDTFSNLTYLQELEFDGSYLEEDYVISILNGIAASKKCCNLKRLVVRKKQTTVHTDSLLCAIERVLECCPTLECLGLEKFQFQNCHHVRPIQEGIMANYRSQQQQQKQNENRRFSLYLLACQFEPAATCFLLEMFLKTDFTIDTLILDSGTYFHLPLFNREQREHYSPRERVPVGDDNYKVLYTLIHHEKIRHLKLLNHFAIAQLSSLEHLFQSLVDKDIPLQSLILKGVTTRSQSMVDTLISSLPYIYNMHDLQLPFRFDSKTVASKQALLRSFQLNTSLISCYLLPLSTFWCISDRRKMNGYFQRNQQLKTDPYLFCCSQHKNDSSTNNNKSIWPLYFEHLLETNIGRNIVFQYFLQDETGFRQISL